MVSSRQALPWKRFGFLCLLVALLPFRAFLSFENRWIHRLEAELNVERFQHGSFSGDFAARAADQVEELVID